MSYFRNQGPSRRHNRYNEANAVIENDFLNWHRGAKQNNSNYTRSSCREFISFVSRENYFPRNNLPAHLCFNTISPPTHNYSMETHLLESWCQPEHQGQATNLWHRVYNNAHQNYISSDFNSHDRQIQTAHPNKYSMNCPPGRKRYQKDNLGCTLKLSQNPRLIETYGGLPWRLPTKVYETGFRGLHDEIEDFCKFIMPTSLEHCIREWIIKKIQRVLKQHFPNARVEVFGSTRTGLYLPLGDIDIVVYGQWAEIPPLFNVEEILLENNLAAKNLIWVFDKATVPIIKFHEKYTNIAVDLVFNQANCVRSAHLVRQCLKIYPNLSKLTMLLKEFLYERNLNEVYTGGVSSYTLTLLVISFFQERDDQDSVRNPSTNLGKLLMEFLELYGCHFNYDKFAIRIKNGGAMVNKADMKAELGQAGSPCLYDKDGAILCLEDPLTPGNDVARGSYKFEEIRRNFKKAFETLVPVVSKSYAPLHNADHSVLGRILRVIDNVVKFRQNIAQCSSLLTNEELGCCSIPPMLPSHAAQRYPNYNQSKKMKSQEQKRYKNGQVTSVTSSAPVSNGTSHIAVPTKTSAILSTNNSLNCSSLYTPITLSSPTQESSPFFGNGYDDPEDIDFDVETLILGFSSMKIPVESEL